MKIDNSTDELFDALGLSVQLPIAKPITQVPLNSRQNKYLDVHF